MLTLTCLSLNWKRNLNLINSNTFTVALSTLILYTLIWELVGPFSIAIFFQLVCPSPKLASVAITWSQLNTTFWIVNYMTMLEHNSYINWKVCLKTKSTLTPKRTSLKNTAAISIYSLQSKPSLLDQRECSSMNKTNLINTMVAYTDHSETHSFSPLALLPLLPFSQPYLSLFSALFQPFVPFLSTFLNVKHPNPSDMQCLFNISARLSLHHRDIPGLARMGHMHAIMCRRVFCVVYESVVS